MARQVGPVSKLVLLVLVGAYVVGCGGGEEPSSSASKEVSGTVRTYLSAVANGDGEEACGELTGDEARQIFEEDLVLLPELQISSCSDAVSKLNGILGGEEKEALENAETSNVKVDGDSATADLVGGTKTVHLSNVNGRWLISGGLTAAP